jgi:hypothetical protein
MSERLPTDLPERLDSDATGDDPRPDELTVADQRHAERVDRERRASGDVPDDDPPGSIDESSYPSEHEQGAAQPSPADAAD